MPAVIAHYIPEIADARTRFNAVLEAGGLDPRIAELVRLFNAFAIDCNYCKNVRYTDDAGQPHLDEADVAAVLDTESPSLDAPARAALAFARAYLLDASAIPGAVTDELRNHFTDAEIVELTLTVARCRAGAKTLMTLGLEPEAMPVTVI
jgi:alkylhydroperoxidase family enzyme